jgi:glycosyltransferase involved in cell wall biosynthesis
MIIDTPAEDAAFNPLDFPSIFTKPRRLVNPYSWVEHIPFAMFLIEVLRPRVLVELGTHSGNSYCAMCQAVQQHNIDTKCYAVDTWEGDEHSGLYGPEVLQDLRDHHDFLYGGFSRLIQSTFDDTVDAFPSNGIDLLHIDGLHTYDSVRHDFELWLPKLSPDGVVLFHDINVREGDFGVWRFWLELAAYYPHFEFAHGNGLGVLALTKNQPTSFLKLLNASRSQASRIRSFFAECGLCLRVQAEMLGGEHQHSKSKDNQVDKIAFNRGSGEGSAVEVHAQLYIPTSQGHLEERSHSITLQKHEWTKVTFDFECRDIDATVPLRLDPVDRVGVVEVASIEVRSQVHDSIIWRAVGNEGFEAVHVLGTACPIAVRNHFSLFCFDTDPQIHLPHIPELARYGPVRLDSWIRFSPDLSAVGDVLEDTQRQLDSRLAESKVTQGILETTQQKLATTQKELEDKEGEIDTLRKLVAERDTSISSSRDSLAALQREISDLYGSVSWRITAPLRRFAWLKSKPFWGFSPGSRWRMLLHQFRRNKQPDEYHAIRQSGLFDDEFYLRRYKDVQSSGMDPLFHYVEYGALERRNPNPYFHTRYYLRQCPEVAASRTNPLLHYIQIGAAQGLNPSPLFNTGAYMEQNPEVAVSRMNPLRHYIMSKADGIDYLPTDYAMWLQTHALTDEKVNWIRIDIESLTYKPTISIIMPVYNIDEIWLRKAIDSVLAQLYPHWELCIVDDASTKAHVRMTLEEYARRDNRIRVHYLASNKGMAIAYNEALSLATGEFIGTLDHDDELTQDALYENVKLLNANPNLDMIYSDEDKIDVNNHRSQPFFKPDYCPDLLLSLNYICHFTIFRRSIVTQIGGFRAGFDGSQDYDLILRFIQETQSIAHIPRILYHWRQVSGSVAAGSDAKPYAYSSGQKALTDYLERNQIAGSVETACFLGSYRVKRAIISPEQVSILIPFKDKADILSKCVSSILEKTDYQNYEIVLINNQSTEESTYDYLDSLAKIPKIRLLNYGEPFNFSAINNFAAQQAAGHYLLLLNNDTEVISEEWLSAMIEHGQRSEVGIVGAKLLYPNRTIQHAGIVMGLGTGEYAIAGHAFRHFSWEHEGYFGFANLIRNYSAVTGACMLVRKAVYEELGGLDEEHLTIAFNDVDFCLRAREKGYLVVYTPYALLYHHESLSRGNDNDLKITDPSKYERVIAELAYMESRWKTYIDNDPFYSKHLTRDGEDFGIRIWDESR